MSDTDRTKAIVDPWRGIKRGDRFYAADWNAANGDELWYEVSDLWFDPVRGQRSFKRGYMAAVTLMGHGHKTGMAASTLIGKRFVRVDVAHTRAAADAAWLTKNTCQSLP